MMDDHGMQEMDGYSVVYIDRSEGRRRQEAGRTEGICGTVPLEVLREGEISIVRIQTLLL